MSNLFALSVDSHFVAAMELPSISGPCNRLHGHTYLVKIIVTGDQLDQHGMLIDHTLVRDMLQDILQPLDHQYLNALPLFSETPPTAEHLARHIFHAMEAAIDAHPITIQEVQIAENPHVNISYRRT
jgi:6-pyruvoyltetrahydropterin/6-carboxytetrahydropterin synthase